MRFVVIDKHTRREVSSEKIEKLAEAGGLVMMDIDGFAVTEDGQLILLDECGNYCFANNPDFEIKLLN